MTTDRSLIAIKSGDAPDLPVGRGLPPDDHHRPAQRGNRPAAKNAQRRSQEMRSAWQAARSAVLFARIESDAQNED